MTLSQLSESKPGKTKKVARNTRKTENLRGGGGNKMKQETEGAVKNAKLGMATPEGNMICLHTGLLYEAAICFADVRQTMSYIKMRFVQPLLIGNNWNANQKSHHKTAKTNEHAGKHFI